MDRILVDFILKPYNIESNFMNFMFDEDDNIGNVGKSVVRFDVRVIIIFIWWTDLEEELMQTAEVIVLLVSEGWYSLLLKISCNSTLFLLWKDEWRKRIYHSIYHSEHCVDLLISGMTGMVLNDSDTKYGNFLSTTNRLGLRPSWK